ncbi:aminodeoxychorismate lyase [Pseudarthrobacter sp. J75]|uniref:aminodeoxychorismate lyase n=1 Tax=unclassified Pseudarthrobacter TaxID=2647000 RepID=UPI002E8186FA|nr:MULTISPECIES: aminodeoxychorismate lyase [unclassified Pseudarthrobacter]MEE2524195.1 aminodeoxychorismate lyase [Pseudarthrobacter sp. J47]MEE2530233.1 aminodeoxychorismate lyase [Pseudarthrobacter sp. J75]MEE2568897.1 aminodeoxychorismate lyase [Pseudarthrobacter sp. J64]
MTSPAPLVLVFLDPAHPAGRLADATQPQLMATDQGATRGDGVFESMLAVGGQVRKMQAHLDRLQGSARALDLVIPGQLVWRAAVDTAVAAYRSQFPAATPEDDEIVVKLIASRGPEGSDTPTAWVQASPPPAAGRLQRETGIDVVLLDRGYDSTVAERAPWLLLGAKTLSYAVNMAALRHAHKVGADDVIFTSSDGRVLEGPTSTVLLAHYETTDDGDGGTRVTRRLITPQLDSGILPGTSQGALFTAAKAAGWELGYGPLEPEDLFSADAVWLISSIRLLAPVNHIDGREIGTPELRKQLTAELSELFAGIGG